MQTANQGFQNIKYLFFLYYELRLHEEYIEYVDMYSHIGRSTEVSSEPLINFVDRYKEYRASSNSTNITLYQYVHRLILELLTAGSSGTINSNKIESIYEFLKTLRKQISIDLIRAIPVMRKSFRELLETEYNPFSCLLYVIFLDIAVLGLHNAISSWEKSLIALVSDGSYFYARSYSPISSDKSDKLKKKFNCKYCFESLDKELLAGSVVKFKGKTYDLSLSGGLKRMLRGL